MSRRIEADESLALPLLAAAAPKLEPLIGGLSNVSFTVDRRGGKVRRPRRAGLSRSTTSSASAS